MVMDAVTEFESFEKQILELVGEFKLFSTSDNRLRELLRVECTRAEAAISARAASDRSAAEARQSAAAASAGATQAATALATANDQLTGVKLQFELAERQRAVLEERCIELSGQISLLEKELQQLRPIQTVHSSLQRQYLELQERVCGATEEARREASRLESELRRVEKCASGGSEIRERARLAAAAHARERRLAAAELQHMTEELLTATGEIARLTAFVAELQIRLAQHNDSNKLKKMASETDEEVIFELRAMLDAERAGNAKLEQALAAAIADNSTLASQLNLKDNAGNAVQADVAAANSSVSTNIHPIDSFLAEEIAE